MTQIGTLLSHTTVAVVAAISGAFVTYIVTTDQMDRLFPSAAHAQASGTRSSEIITQAMPDIAREMRISLTERVPGNGSTPHRHPGHHTFGYVLEGTYEVKIDEAPVRQLRAGESFYEPPGALHAVSRNPSTDKPVKYLVIQVGDPTKPRTIQE
jgi:quercetin dioxygenase-like cupin family protein